MYLPDANAWIHYLRLGSASGVTRRINRLPATAILISAVVKGELYHGAYRSRDTAQELADLATLFAAYRSLAFDDDVALVYGCVHTCSAATR